MYKKRVALLVILSLLLSFSAAFSQTDVSDFEKRLKKIQEEIENLRSRMREETEKEQTILSKLEAIGFKKKVIRKEISLYNIQLEKTTKELLSLKNSIELLKKKLEKEKKSIQKTLVTLYKYGRLSFFEFMLQTKDIRLFLSQSKNLSLLAQYQEKIISDYLHTYHKLKEAEKKLEQKKEETSELVEMARAKKKELDAQERKNRAFIRRIEGNIKVYEEAIREREERDRQLREFMNKIIKEKIVFPFPFIPFYEKKGELPWPLEGRIVTSFGIKKHPRFNTKTKSNGIEIKPIKKDRVIKAVHPGKVAFADYFKGYGNLIIIDHGLAYYTLYGHCSEFLVETGDLVNAEQPIATAGDFGSLKGITLYFEIRHKTEPENPLEWLRKRTGEKR
ncbi:MAG: murein hydrolase activator EnvC family protein [Candidatus Aminicenantales bacterium]